MVSRLGINLYVGYSWYWMVLDGVANHRLQNAEAVRRESYSPIIGLPRQISESQSCNPRGVGSRSRKARCRSPQRRGTKEKELAVSFLSIRNPDQRCNALLS